ncbi:MAG: ABC transporter permease [Silvanigrellales bacterium]|nr:ABC transporter permease [Silvanigrellales bacterium]
MLHSVNARSPWVRTWTEIRGNKLAFLSFGIVVATALIAVFAPWLAPHSPEAMQLVEGRLLPPFFMEGGNTSHVLGTDATGRDVLSRLIYGSRVSLCIGIVPVFFGCLIGIPVGLAAGYLGGKVDEALMRVTDILLAFPSILLALIIVAFLGQGIFNLMIAVGLASAPAFARIVRSAVLSERNREYVASAESLGSATPRIVWRHIFPNITSSLIVLFTINFASALLEAAGLSFLGLGVKPPTAEWGAMLADGKNYFYDGWWMIVFPGIAIFLVVMSLNILGDSLRDALDPRAAKR